MHDLLESKAFVLVVGVVLLLIVGSVVSFLWHMGDNVGYAPEQPIPFSHKIHAGDNAIPCLYCHSNADNSRHATVPGMNVCMNCHSVVKTDSPHIQKLTSLYKEGKAVEWVKVHDMADFVFFNHKRHVQRGVACETCHGDVKEMERIEQKKILNMGYCVNCHRAPENNAPTDCWTCHH